MCMTFLLHMFASDKKNLILLKLGKCCLYLTLQREPLSSSDWGRFLYPHSLHSHTKYFQIIVPPCLLLQNLRLPQLYSDFCSLGRNPSRTSAFSFQKATVPSVDSFTWFLRQTLQPAPSSAQLWQDWGQRLLELQFGQTPCLSLQPLWENILPGRKKLNQWWLLLLSTTPWSYWLISFRAKDHSWNRKSEWFSK